MAYIDRSSNTRRTTTAIAVAAIQAGVIYAVATGLAVNFIAPPKPMENPQATQIPIDPITPDKPKENKKLIQPETQTPSRDQMTAVKNDLVPPKSDDFADETGLVPTGTGGDGLVVLPEPPKVLPQTFSPRFAKPKNAPGSWATANDYPAADLRAGNQGLTGFRLSIGTDGKVLNCEVTRPSGFPRLDRTACDKITRRARFEPAMDGYGNKVTGTYSNNIRWEIPD